MQYLTNFIAVIGVYFASINLWAEGISGAHDLMSLVVITMTVFWLGVQIWAKIKMTKLAIKADKKKGPKNGT